jgi:hypothetical protein
MTVEERLAVLEQRLRRAEDELAIARLMASYGPLADAGDADAVAGLWAEDGEYDVDGWHMRSRAGEGCRYLTGNTLFVDGGRPINGVAWTPDLDAAP